MFDSCAPPFSTHREASCDMLFLFGSRAACLSCSSHGHVNKGHRTGCPVPKDPKSLILVDVVSLEIVRTIYHVENRTGAQVPLTPFVAEAIP